LDSLRLPDGFWERQDVGQAPADRDFGALFRLTSKYAGASQTQIAIAVVMTQGQVSTIMAGARRITAIDVAERVFDGMMAPDAARVAYGLAPRGSFTGMAVSDARSADQRFVPAGAGGQGELAGEDNVLRRDVLRLGGTVVASSAASSRMAQIAAALASYPSWVVGSPPARDVVSVGEVAKKVGRTKRDYQACRYGLVLDSLPGLLESVRLACDRATGDDLLRAFALAADAYQVTGSVLLKLDDLSLAALAADRSVEAALRCQDPVVLGASARIVTHSLMSGGHRQRAREIASQAAARMTADVRNPGPDALSVYGALVLRGAVAAALGEDRTEALGMLDEAADAARRLGRDDNARWTAFGPTNVSQHRVHVAMVLGDAGTAIDHARRIDVEQIPLAERKASLFIDTAQAFAQWGKHEQAYQALRAADQVAPEEVRARRSVQGLAADLATRAPRTVRAQAREFAERIGALA
jgi:hypothetical protein